MTDVRMFDPEKAYDTRTLDLPPLAGPALRCAEALSHQAKNLRNIGSFLIRQVVTAYGKDETSDCVLKAELHAPQALAISHFNTVIDAVNADRTARHPGDVAKWLAAQAAGGKAKKKPVLKLVPRLEARMDGVFGSVLDVTVLDNALKTYRNEHGDAVYRRLPVAMAQQVVHRLVESYKAYFAGLAAYKLDPSDMTGMPGLPGYLDKDERFVLEIPFVNVKLSFPRPRQKLRIPENDFALEPSYLTGEMLDAFYAYDVRGAVADACGKRGWEDCTPQHVRLVPLKHGIRMEAVVRIPNPYPAGSFLADLVAGHGGDLAKLKNDKDRSKWLLDYLGSLSAASLPNIGGIDLGKNNLAAVAYSTGDRAAVHIGGRFTANMEELTARIGARVSELTGPRARELQAKKLALPKGGKLPKNEAIELATLLKAIYRDPEVVRLTAKKANWSLDYLHKITTRIVDDCVSRGIGVIVIGRNKGWKQEVNMGTEQNRTFCQIAHAKLIELISYKADAHGIAVVTMEESYTSKTSFVNGDRLRTYADKPEKACRGGDGASHVAPASLSVHGEATAIPVMTGRRGTKKDRHWFFHKKNAVVRWKRVHADVNGAFNIIRKVFKVFAYHPGLTLKFNLFRLSPRTGITPITMGMAA